MEMQQLRYVVAVARTGTFSRAAEMCHVAQPSLSQQIQKLEEELGHRLFDRTRREAKLTPQGEAFLRRAVRILDEADAARREASETSDLARGTLRMGVLPTIAPYLLRDSLAGFRRKFPGIEIAIEEDMTGQLVKQLLAYEIDFAIVSRPVDEDRLEVRELFREELKLALPAGHRLAKKATVSAGDLRSEPLIVMRPGHCLSEQVLGFCERRGISPKVSFRGAQIETIRTLVRAGAGISLVPAMAAEATRSGGPVYRSLAAPRPERAVVAVWPQQRRPGRAAEEFLKIVEESAVARR